MGLIMKHLNYSAARNKQEAEQNKMGITRKRERERWRNEEKNSTLLFFFCLARSYQIKVYNLFHHPLECSKILQVGIGMRRRQ